MMSAYSKSCGYKKISVHTNTKKVSFSNYSTLESVSKKFRFLGSFYAHTSVLVWTEGLTIKAHANGRNKSQHYWTQQC